MIVATVQIALDAEDQRSAASTVQRILCEAAKYGFNGIVGWDFDMPLEVADVPDHAIEERHSGWIEDAAKAARRN